MATWRHTSGGCMIGQPGLACDDVFEADDGRSVMFLSTVEVHTSGFFPQIDLALSEEEFRALVASCAGREDVEAGPIVAGVYLADGYLVCNQCLNGLENNDPRLDGDTTPVPPFKDHQRTCTLCEKALGE